MICRTGLIAELNRPVIQMLYAKKYPQTEKEKEKRLKQIDVDIQCLEEIMKHDLEYRRLLIL